VLVDVLVLLGKCAREPVETPVRAVVAVHRLETAKIDRAHDMRIHLSPHHVMSRHTHTPPPPAAPPAAAPHLPLPCLRKLAGERCETPRARGHSRERAGTANFDCAFDRAHAHSPSVAPFAARHTHTHTHCVARSVARELQVAWMLAAGGGRRSRESSSGIQRSNADFPAPGRQPRRGCWVGRRKSLQSLAAGQCATHRPAGMLENHTWSCSTQNRLMRAYLPVAHAVVVKHRPAPHTLHRHRIPPHIGEQRLHNISIGALLFAVCRPHAVDITACHERRGKRLAEVQVPGLERGWGRWARSQCGASPHALLSTPHHKHMRTHAHTHPRTRTHTLMCCN
jgi:hypothetical protein